MNAQEIWAMARQHGFAMWGKLAGDWKHIVALDGEQATITTWQLPSEIGTAEAHAIVQLNSFTEFDLTN